ncbi:tRNA dihydrouridine synthase [Legionella spiritensis]|uniref:tRNA-dihydrouridine synthase n=1 Tax=Legionella spiritensis TaxID=452 RepID=A0A0W0ZAU1_LEGSP|nr:tRNA-dihydrouridine synthase family protein [Legionella spiritensis]KTD66274.1 nitrogen regulation protein [Legionella spiritensis]SNV48429.1 nitrogen regulation protein [Legionella spiritensis]
MRSFLNNPLAIGSLSLPNRLIQGPLAGFSCAPFRQLFHRFTPPAYCVSEMISAYDLVHKHTAMSRYLYRAPEETILGYQISGNDPKVMADAAVRLENLSADLIDINCGCPKPKIRKKGAGSALLEQPQLLYAIVDAIRQRVRCPLTVKIRLQGREEDIRLAQIIEQAGADALIVHGRRWVDDYDTPCDLKQIARIRQATSLPLIVNGDLQDITDLQTAWRETGCDAFMIARAGTGKPWLYQELLHLSPAPVTPHLQKQLFLQHLHGLAALENEHRAVLQSKSLVRYYFREQRQSAFLSHFYTLKSLRGIEQALGMTRDDGIRI